MYVYWVRELTLYTVFTILVIRLQMENKDLAYTPISSLSADPRPLSFWLEALV